MLPLADFSPLTPSSQWGMVSLLGIALMVVTIWSMTRRQPPLDGELAKLNSAIGALQKSVSSLELALDKVAAHAVEIETLRTKVRVLEEHREKDLHAQRTYTRETTREIFVALDNMKSSFAANTQQIERAIGKLEGSLSGMDDRVTRIESREPATA